MNRLTKPLLVMPRTYVLPIGLGWDWCKLGEVLAVARGIGKALGTNYNPTPENFIRHFAGLAPFNNPTGKPEGWEKKKYFRYSVDGNSFDATEVPFKNGEMPHNSDFSLDIPQPYPLHLFVREDWVRITLKAIREGCIRGIDFTDVEPTKYGRIGLRPYKESIYPSSLQIVKLEEPHPLPVTT